jgi:hypothetical protein
MVLCIVNFTLSFGLGFLLVECESCFKDDALVRVFLSYFLWCVGNVSGRC